jgi:two-component system sensor histidine kinase CpxA
MLDATARIADGDFEVTVDRRRRNELGLLAGSITRMASRLETFVTGQRRSLGSIAHELRSPLERTSC